MKARSPKQPRITLSLICRDNEQTLPRLFSSLAEERAVDRIVACDTGSADHTLEVLTSWGISWVSSTWVDDYSASRNWALKQVEAGSWVLSLDSDEWVAHGFGEALRSAVATLEEAGHDEVGLSVWMRNLADSEGYANVLPMFAPRVFKNLPGTIWKFPIHEQVWRNNAPIGFAPNNALVVQHDGYLVAEFVAKGKYERNVRILRKAVEEDPTEPWHRYNLGEALFSQKLLPEAVVHFRTCIDLSELSGTSDRIMAVTSRMRLAGCLMAMGEAEEALVTARKLATDHPAYAEGLATLALVLSSSGKFYEAADVYDQVMAIGTLVKQGAMYPYIGDESLRGWRAAIYQGRAMAKAAEYVRAVESYAQASVLGSPVADPLLEGAACMAALGRVDLAYLTLNDAAMRFPGHPRVAEMRDQLARESAAAVERFRSIGIPTAGGIT